MYICNRPSEALPRRDGYIVVRSGLSGRMPCCLSHAGSVIVMAGEDEEPVAEAVEVTQHEGVYVAFRC